MDLLLFRTWRRQDPTSNPGISVKGNSLLIPPESEAARFLLFLVHFVHCGASGTMSGTGLALPTWIKEHPVEAEALVRRIRWIAWK